MNTLLVIAGGLQCVVILVWLYQHVAMRRIRTDELRVPVVSSECDLPALTVIIPARNEARRIEDCIRSVLSQDVPHLEVIIADDRSTDDTSRAAAQAAGGDERLRLVRIETLPIGWMGKSHALWTAAQEARSPWLLMLDADCRVMAPHGLASALCYARRHRADLLSLWPRDGSRGFWEGLLLPLCGAMIVIWYGRAAANDETSDLAFANGQFLLIRRDVYFGVGGHEAVRDALVEDIPLARVVKRSGARVRSAIGTDIFVVRMYESLRDIVRGWQRIYLGVLTPPQMLLCIGSIAVGSLPPFLILPFVAQPWLDGRGGWCAVFGWLGLAHLVALMATSIRFFSIARCRLRFLLLYPLSCLGVAAILFGAWARSLRNATVIWRQTAYEVADSRIIHGKGGH